MIVDAQLNPGVDFISISLSAFFWMVFFIVMLANTVTVLIIAALAMQESKNSKERSKPCNQHCTRKSYEGSEHGWE